MKIANARHILVKTKDEADRLKKELVNGADFSKLAKKHSKCASAKRFGDLGQVSPGQMVKPIDTVIFKKKTHTVHGPIKSKFGFHLVEVMFRS